MGWFHGIFLALPWRLQSKSPSSLAWLATDHTLQLQ